MPPFISQAQPKYPDNADVSKQLMLLGDTIGKGISEYQKKSLLADVLKPGPDGSVDYGKATIGLLQMGEPQMASALANIAGAKEDRAFRQSEAQRSQRNADRSFGLQAANAGEDRAFRREQFAFEKDYKEKELGLKRLDLHLKNQGGFKDVKERSVVEAGLRKEYTNLAGDFIKVQDSFGRIQASAKNPSPAGDLALIFNYMKMLDPGSTVREGEFSTAQNSSGVPEQIRAQWNKALTGERLTPDIRNDFLGRAKMLYDVQSGQHKKLTEQFKGIGGRLGVDVLNVVPDLTASGQPTVADPTIPPPPPGFEITK